MLVTAESVAEQRRSRRLLRDADINARADAEAHALARRNAELSDRLEAGDPTHGGVSGMHPTHGLMAFLADSECAHGRLPTDTTPPCGCYPSELPTAVPTPGPAVPPEGTQEVHVAHPTLSIEETRQIVALLEEIRMPPVEAPYGYKADGTPRRRPGRKPTVTPEEAAGMLTFEKITAEVLTEAERLSRECDVQRGVVVAANAKLAALEEQKDRVDKALANLREAAGVEVPA